MRVKVGFIGLGEMGKGIAKNLAKKGADLVVFDVREEPVKELVQMGAKKASSPKELAAATNVIFSMVRDDAQTEEVMWGKNGVFDGIRSGSTIILTSTISPSLCQRIAKDASKEGVGVLDSPVSGAKTGAEAGTLTLMIGGDEDLYNKLEPVLQLISANRFYLGGIGMGEVGKLANNIIALNNVISTTEGLTFAVRAGIPLKTILDMVKVSTGNNWVTQHWDLITALKKERGQPSATWELGRKDLRLALEYAKKIDVELPLASLSIQLDLYRLPDE